ncbi:AI-2E family transporter [Mycolicibacterium porcinum]|uniref:AI-2E family transporter n=1 Tax=Mycolicibacterium porcinum TaxID=39693 RepID=A0AAW5T1X5_9MYCO|nr:AI-2E family transporter [Mycolicibacterium porcinum]MCV7389369.1 AI-2E family transporter [Mycolicibacterium porcinum]ORB44867.1 AI-2E family transporter [Mycolicibacterium porcinum]
MSGRDASAAGGEAAHDDAVGQPHTDAEGDMIVAAEKDAAQISSPAHPLGEAGPRFSRASPFMIGMVGAAGVAVTYGGIELLIAAHEVLILIFIAAFLAIGLEPAVSWLVRHRLPRWAAVTVVFLVAFALLAGFAATAVPPLVTQGNAFVHNAPDYLHHLQQRYPSVDQLDNRFHLQDKLKDALAGSNVPAVVGGIVGAGKVVVGAVGGTVIVLVLTAYFLANFARIRASLYRLAPASRRPRTILIGDEIFAKVGGYVLGNILISVITAVLAFTWLMAFDVPYPLLLALLVAVLDLIPIVGSTLAGLIVALVALTVSVPVSLATVVFFIVLRFAEDYLLVPRIIGRTVQVPPLVTVVAVLLGGALLGIVGALLAIPVAAAILLLARETLFPQLDRR